MEDNTIIKIWALTVLAALQIAAILMGIDGAYYMLVVAAVTGLGGYEIGKKSGKAPVFDK